jgi:hypothetical protein
MKKPGRRSKKRPTRWDYTCGGSQWVVQELDTQVDGLTVYHRTIIIKSGQRGLDALDTWTHEGLHAAFPDLTEAQVVQGAAFLAGLLWMAGYRRAR